MLKRNQKRERKKRKTYYLHNLQGLVWGIGGKVQGQIQGLNKQ